MLDACDRQSVPCTAFLQPARSVTHASGGGPEGWALQETLERRSYDEIRARLAKLEPRYRVHDLSGVFAAGEQWFVDPVHFGDRGQAVVAEAMLPAVLAMLRGDLRPAGTSACRR
jgi:hypothetical protein